MSYDIYWILDDQHIPRPANHEEFFKFFEDDKKRRVAETKTSNGYWVSTVFLGINHSYSSRPPVLFETMAFPTNGTRPNFTSDRLQWRYETWDEAVAGHEAAVYKIENDLEVPD